jgi:hypothetical protein
MRSYALMHSASPLLLATFLAASLPYSAHAAPYLLASATVNPGVSAPTSSFDAGSSGTIDSGVASFISVDSSDFGSAHSSTSFTTIRNYAAVTLTGYSSNTYGFANAAEADSYVSDYFTITGGAGTGYLQLVFDVSGTASKSGDLGLLDGPWAQGTLALYNRAFPEAAPLGTPFSSWGFTGAETLVSAPIAFTYGVEFALTLTSSAFVGPADDGGSYTYDFTGTADFGSTIHLTDFIVSSDSQGNTPVNFTLASQSGTNYPTNTVGPPSAVPEPASLALVLGGIAVLSGTRRKKRA